MWACFPFGRAYAAEWPGTTQTDDGKDPFCCAQSNRLCAASAVWKWFLYTCSPRTNPRHPLRPLSHTLDARGDCCQSAKWANCSFYERYTWIRCGSYMLREMGNRGVSSLVPAAYMTECCVIYFTFLASEGKLSSRLMLHIPHAPRKLRLLLTWDLLDRIIAKPSEMHFCDFLFGRLGNFQPEVLNCSNKSIRWMFWFFFYKSLYTRFLSHVNYCLNQVDLKFINIFSKVESQVII